MVFNGVIAKRNLVILFLVFAGLYLARPFLVPLAIGLILSALFLPLVRWLERKKIRRGLAALICLLVLITAILGIVFLLASQFYDLVSDLPLIRQNTMALIREGQQFILQHFGIPVPQQAAVLGGRQVSVGQILPMMAGPVFTILVNAVLIPAYVFLLLYYRHHLREFVLRLSPANQQEEVSTILHNVSRVSQQYVVGLAKMIGCLWLMYGVAFSSLGVENALFFAILCGLLEIIPFVGNLTGTAITLLVAAANGANPALLLGVLVTYALVQFIQGWFLEPLILGPQVRINPLFTIISLVIGQLVWGLAGILLAIPLVAMFKIVCDHIESLKPLGFVIGETGKKRKKR